MYSLYVYVILLWYILPCVCVRSQLMEALCILQGQLKMEEQQEERSLPRAPHVKQEEGSASGVLPDVCAFVNIASCKVLSRKL